MEPQQDSQENNVHQRVHVDCGGVEDHLLHKGKPPTFTARFDCTPWVLIASALSDVLCMQIRPLEEAYKFGDFFSSYLNESDFHAKPSVLLLGQYSTGAPDCTPSYLPAINKGGELLAQRPSLPAGKTTFIKHLLKREYPGIHIGPEPTTDRFVVVMSGMEERRTPGNSLIVMPDRPFQVTLCSAHPQDTQQLRTPEPLWLL